MLKGEAAITQSLKKLKNANKIIQKNQLLGKDDKTSHLVTYFNEINKKMIVPRSLGMIHRKSEVNQLNLRQQPLTNEYANAFTKALPRAKFIDSVVLNGSGLNDVTAIKIIKSMDITKMKALDLSNNPGLTEKFYDELCDVIENGKCMLERLELEGNMIGDRVL